MGAEPKILVARLDYDKTVYALERQETGLYSLCKLSNGVDLGLLSRDASLVAAAVLRKRSSSKTEEPRALPTTTISSHHESKKRRLAIEAIQSLVKKPPPLSLEGPSAGDASDLQVPIEHEVSGLLSTAPSPLSVAQDAQPPPVGTSEGTTEDVHHANSALEDLARPDADTIFDSIRRQYQETLYHSRGSLAYFAKGPLSRARAAFHLDCDGDLEMVDLVEYLKTLIMTTVQIDKKYREIVPEIIAKCKLIAQDSDEENKAAKAKKRRAKKMKLNKDGLYPDDEEHVRKWWSTRRPKPKDDEDTTRQSPQEARWEISYLRSRETQLQMILILEILSLQPLCTSDNGADSQQPSLPGDDAVLHEDASQPQKKKRNRHNLPFLLDVHADRLTIWHSTALDDVNMVDGTDSQRNPEDQDSLRPTADPLKDFCVDIIVPFFSARLPEQCDSINRKLGGPVMISPPKPRSKARRRDVSASKAKAKPETTSKRSGSSSHKSSLENVLSRESLNHRRSMSRGPSGMIALMRSASTPLLPAMKREASEPAPVANIPTATEKDTAQSPSANGAQGVKRKLGEDRVKKDAQVKAELKSAISALRRPNREVVGQAMEEDAERRATTTLSQLKKSRKPQMHPRMQSVVKATPTTSRFKDVLGRDAFSQPAFGAISEDVDAYDGPSSASMVPSSAPRKQRRSVGLDDRGSVRPRPATARRSEQVEATPAKPIATRSETDLLAGANDEGCVLASSPVMSRKIAQPRFLQAGYRAGLSHRDSGISMPSSPSAGLMETPVKRSAPTPSMPHFVSVTPVKRSADIFAKQAPATVVNDAVVTEKPKSIYARLGWDDEDEDDLC
ncbi:DNA replication regulator SLD3-domain-containing protein [Microdochium trichocladiopsis]|uniref:DNA replication regulator SLD3-domain-containing protein n=1 Tax=Microdochium trichocladiopsis TaxID=1682393 RepID=A0A9P8Y3M0_9PEZI|nr:DNA replication regulator SLD3-domain-containing protein [Microdochium trichocladiopsis]KAH7026572.1 DNA replication regulator SLD3-domain-containing protein [Microdochium trichocladiopsis]